MPESEVGLFAERVISSFLEEVTDLVFLKIENDKNLMKEYLDLVSEKKLGDVNRAIGRAVKMRLHLENAMSREYEPKSKLIQSHQMFDL